MIVIHATILVADYKFKGFLTSVYNVSLEKKMQKASDQIFMVVFDEFHKFNFLQRHVTTIFIFQDFFYSYTLFSDWLYTLDIMYVICEMVH